LLNQLSQANKHISDLRKSGDDNTPYKNFHGTPTQFELRRLSSVIAAGSGNALNTFAHAICSIFGRGSHDFLCRDFSHNFNPIEAANNVSQHRATTFHKRSTGTEERLPPAISGPSVPFVAVNSLDSNFFHASVDSVTDGNHERSSSSKTSQQISFGYHQAVSPLKMVEGPVSQIWYNGGRSSAISRSSDSFAADNSLDPTPSVGSNAVDNYGRSSSLKTSQQFSFDYLQVVSPQKKVEERGSGVGGNGGGRFAEKG